MITRILVLFCVAALNFGISTAEYKLHHVVVTHRSGEHTPCDFPSGPNITKKSESESTLTEEGVNRAYNLGKELGNKYKTLLGSSTKWTSEDYYTMGTYSPRNLMAALNVGAGLEQSDKITEWTEKEQRIVEEKKTKFNHTKEYVKFYNQDECPAFFEALKGQMSTLMGKLGQYASKIQGVTAKQSDLTARNPQSVWLGYETYLSQNGSDPSRTTWLTKEMWNGLKGFSQEFLLGVESTDNLRRLSGGIMVDSILNITEKIKKGENPPGRDDKHSHKMSVLAVSQGPLAAMIGAFSPKGTTYKGKEFDAETFYPNNGAYHVVEIYKKEENNNNDIKIKVLYSNGNGTTPASLIYPDCEDDGKCTYELLRKALKDVRLPGGQQDAECKKVKSKPK